MKRPRTSLLKNPHNDTALKVATAKGNYYMANLLKTHGAKE
jgi:hypothetical protein